MIIYPEKYFWPFLEGNFSIETIVDSLTEMKRIPLKIEAWHRFSQECICPFAISKKLNYSPGAYVEAIEELEQCLEKGFLIRRCSVPENNIEELLKANAADYKGAFYKYEWGYDDEIVLILSELKEALKADLKDTSELLEMSKSIFKIYSDLYIKKQIKLEQNDRNLLVDIRKSLLKNTFDEALTALIINRIKHAKDKNYDFNKYNIFFNRYKLGVKKKQEEIAYKRLLAKEFKRLLLVIAIVLMIVFIFLSLPSSQGPEKRIENTNFVASQHDIAEVAKVREETKVETKDTMVDVSNSGNKMSIWQYLVAISVMFALMALGPIGWGILVILSIVAVFID